MSELTHIDDEGEARMVDVSAKPEQEREAVARGEIRLAKATIDTIESGQAPRATCWRQRAWPASWPRKKPPT